MKKFTFKEYHHHSTVKHSKLRNAKIKHILNKLGFKQILG